MPLPTPHDRESRGDFVSRCIQFLNDKGEMKDNNQRIAVCYTQWKDAKASAGAVVGSGDKETLVPAIKAKADSEENTSTEYINQAKQVIAELLDSALKVKSFLDNPEYIDKASEIWVFEKMVLSKAMICGAARYIEFGEVEEEQEKEENKQNVGLIEPAKVTSEDEIRQKVYDNKFGADTY